MEHLYQGPNAFPVSLPPFKEDFHPRRNQAREKMANLTKSRFQAIVSDVLFELENRFPEFEQLEDVRRHFLKMWTSC